MLADGLHEMRLAEARNAVEKEWIVGAPGGIRHGPRGRVGKTVAAANHKAAKGVARVEPVKALADLGHLEP